MNSESNNDDKKADKKQQYVRRERYSGSVQRSFYVDKVDKEHSSAEYKDGVLKVTLPKLTKEATKTQIAVK